MSDQVYNWKRFWCPRTGSFNLSAGGYLVDPDSEWGRLYNPDVVPFESIAMLQCLVLLGEPGVGKSHAMQTAQNEASSKIQEKGEQILCIDLRSYGSEDRLIRELFKNRTFFSWKRGKHRLHVFLDSLDECLLRIDTLATLLIDELKKHPVERLSLRIACRAADWPNSLETGLVQLWGKDAVGVYELTPLRRVDVIEAAKTNNLDHNVFLQEIDQKEVIPLAIKPVTLSFLINTYIKNGRFPSTQAELYLHGCRLLCEETNESRRNARLMGSLTIGQRLAVALRIAAITVFSNRYAIWTGINRGDVPDEDIAIQDLCGRYEDTNGAQFQINEIAIKETLGTGLFSSRGSNRMGWVHQTYAEFLAARYLAKHKMTLTQIMSLLVHPGDTESKLVPQLHEAAAWVAGMLPEVFRKITSVNPEVLLRSDIATAELKDRATLVESLLKVYDEEGLLDRDRDNRKRYKRLNHPGIVDQLRPYICDSTKGIIVRRVAIDIAEACKLQVLQDDLANIALDQKGVLTIREEAARAVGHIADNNTKVKLKPLATGEAGDDPNDELKACALQALWPIHIKAKELFDILTDSKKQNFVGAYWGFLSYELVPKLSPSDLPIALKWVEQQESPQNSTHCFNKLTDSIILKAWEHLESPIILEAFSKIALSRLKHHDGIVGHYTEKEFRNILSNDDNKRRRILEAMLPLISNPEKDTVRLVYSSTPLVLNKDVTWMLEHLQEEKSKEIQLTWAKLINGAFDWRETGQFDVIIDTSKSNPILAETFSWLLKPIELNSPEAEKMKADYLEIQKWQKRDKERPLLSPPPAERIAGLLDECESDNSSAWWCLNMEMTLEPDSQYYGNAYESDLTVLPGWKNADAVTRHRIIEAAKRYVLEQDPKTYEWLGKNIIHLPAFAGYRALQLLLQEIPDFISSGPANVWKKWAPIILTYPISNSDSNDRNIETHNKLIKLSYQYAPDEIIQTLMAMIDKENKDHGRVYITQKVTGCWDDRLAKALLIKVKDTNLKPECVGCLLGDLLTHQVKEAKAFAELLVSLASISEIERTRAIVAARELVTHAADAGWSTVWSAIQKDVELGHKVIELLAYESDAFATNAGKLLTEDQLTDMYIWIVHQYPYAEDTEYNSEDGQIGLRWKIASFRDSVLNLIKQRGTYQACKAIQQIINRFPESKWLKWTLQEAQDIMRRQTWIPPQSGDILKMASNQSMRLVQNGDQLLEVLIESLKQLEKKLQGETPASIDLWNEIKKNVYRPKDENRFSAYVKRHLDEYLKERGIIVNREVEIRRGEGKNQGERPDIHVDAVMRNQNNKVYDSITVIIEVKGCWSPGVNHKMKTQLMDRYLKDNHCQHGLYLLGWFNCSQWDDKDSRKQRSPKISINEARIQFDTQAVKLSQQSTRIKAFIVNAALR